MFEVSRATFMIDTIKLGIPLTRGQLAKLHKLVAQDENFQWVLWQPSTGEMRLCRSRGLAQLDNHSYHRDIRWDIPKTYAPEATFLTLEFSVPKFWYGHNIRLLYDFENAINHLKKLLEKQLKLRLPKVTDWELWRVDICYAWQCPTQKIAYQILNSLKRLNFPYKKAIIYDESILFPGSTYSLKFYLKLPEFRNHDLKELIKNKASFEWVNYLESLAVGVLRCEATLRRKYLKRKKIETLGDLIKSKILLDWSDEFIENHQDVDFNNPQEIYGCMLIIIGHTFESKGLQFEQAFEFLNSIGESPIPELKDGDVFYAPPKVLKLNSDIQFEHKGGGFTVREIDIPTSMLQYFLKKFLGDNLGMQEADEIKLRLDNHYKAAKATRLLAMWLYVQRFGSKKLKDDIGDRNYYNIKADLKKAGCSFTEPPKVTKIDEEFIKEFKLSVPSSYVVNKVDDFRDSSNIINFLPRLNKKKAENQ